MSIIENTKHWINLEAKKNKRNKFNILVDMVINYLKYRIFPQEYYAYDFYKKPKKKKKTYFTVNEYVKCRKRHSDSQYENVIFLDKYIFNLVFRDYIGRDFMRINGEFTDKSALTSFLQGHKKIIYKPLQACEGRGIMSFDISEFDSKESLMQELLNLPVGIIEEWIVQDNSMNSFYSGGVNCIRIQTFKKNEQFDLISARVSFGIDGDIVNGSLGNNFICLIDISTGKIISDGIDHNDNVFSEHPLTKVCFKGSQIPMWEDVIKLVKEAASLIPNVAYVGWDIAITPNGPILIEGNHCGTCVWGQNYIMRPDGIGERSLWYH